VDAAQGLGKFNDTQHASRRKQVRRHNFLRWERGFHVTVPKPGAPKPKTSIKKFEKKSQNKNKNLNLGFEYKVFVKIRPPNQGHT
jgi:hypothetical protein